MTDSPYSVSPQVIGDLQSLKHAIDEHAIVSMADIKGNITYVNDRFCSLSGYSHEELMGQSHRILKSEFHSPEFYKDMWRAIASGITWHGEIKNRQKDGGSYWVKATIVPVLDEAGKPFQYISIRTEITEHRETEAALAKLEERFRISQSFANIGTWDWNIQTGDLYWSDRIPLLFGGKEGTMETSYDNFLAAIHPDDRQKVIDAVNGCVENDAEYDIEHRVVWPDGTVVWLHETGNVTRDENGNPLNMLGVVQDINARKIAELELADRERQLREAQALAQVGSWQADMTTGELRWSDEIFRIFGHTPGRFAPSIEAFRATVHTDDLELVLDSERQAQKTGRHDVVHRIVLPDGTVRHVHELAQAETDANGQLVRMIGTVQDVTERKTTEAALEAAKEEAENANQAKSRFLSSMSHELRTPLNAILGFGQMLEFNPAEPLSKSQKESVDLILKGGSHLLELINDVLELAQVESGKVELSIEDVNLCDVVDQALELVIGMAKRKNVSVSIQDACSPSPIVQADFTRLKQVLLNLMSNAIKYNHDGGHVAVNYAPSNAGRLRVSVKDSGPGIPKNRQDELFIPFNRLGAETSDIEGSGIGLVVSKDLIKLMGGSVGFASEEGKGSTFWFEVPLVADPARTIDASEGADDTAPSVLSAIQGTVLYVEDNPSNLKLMEKIISHIDGLSMISAHTAELGIELAISKQPNLIIMDINLPGLSGIDALQELRDTDATKGIPVIALSAAATKGDIDKGIQAGFLEYLTKPINVLEITKSIKKHIEAQ